MIASLLSLPLAGMPLQSEPTPAPVDPDKVQAGFLGLIFLVVMGAAVVLLVMSMRRHLARVDVNAHQRHKQAARAAAAAAPAHAQPAEAPSAQAPSAQAVAEPPAAPPHPGPAPKPVPKKKGRK